MTVFYGCSHFETFARTPLLITIHGFAWLVIELILCGISFLFFFFHEVKQQVSSLVSRDPLQSGTEL